MYFGISVPDPYRWLEDGKSTTTTEWLQAQTALTTRFLDGSAAPQLRQRVRELWDYERQLVPWTRGGRTFFFREEGLQNHAVLWVIDWNRAQPRVLFDPNPLSDDGSVALSYVAVSEDGSLLAYGLTSCGSDWTELRVRNVATSEDLPDRLRWVRFSDVSWAHDESGFFYSRYDEPVDRDAVPYNHKLFFHKIGTSQDDDVLVFADSEHKERRFHATVTEDGRYLVIHVVQTYGAKNWVYYKDLATGEIVKLLDKEDARWTFMNNDGPLFWFMTDLDAPRGRLVAIDVSKSSPENLNMKEVLPEPAEATVSFQGIHVVGDRFFALYLRDTYSEVNELKLDGSFIGKMKLPGIGSVSDFRGRRVDEEFYYAFTSFTTPLTVYRYDMSTRRSTVHFEPNVGVDTSKYVTKLVFVTSKDGTTKVPLFISYRKGLKRNGKNPTYLWGYGGFGASVVPYFVPNHTLWMDLGGVYARAALRGGGEYGKSWHEAGTKLRKQNVFDDFIACAQWLIDESYTCPDKLAIVGASNGGLLVGACMTQRPELFGAAVSMVGVMDMLRYHRFTAGDCWKEEYGCVDDSEEQFLALLAYSPVHNLRPGNCYPATFVCAADGDDRVVPYHSYKYLAALQHAQAGPGLCLMRLETESGHGQYSPLAKDLNLISDILAFLVYALKIPSHKLKRLNR
jgi:prolyl oligopeptidase